MVLFVANSDCQGKDRVRSTVRRRLITLLGLLDLRHSKNCNFKVVSPRSLKVFVFVCNFYWIIVDLSEQERLLSSVIKKLEGSTEHNPSTALAHAYALRAKTSFEDLKYPLAIEDAQKAIDYSNIATSATLSTAYRVWADAEQACGSGQAIAVLQRWHRAQPTYRTKLQKEIQDIRESNST